MVFDLCRAVCRLHTVVQSRGYGLKVVERGRSIYNWMLAAPVMVAVLWVLVRFSLVEYYAKQLPVSASWSIPRNTRPERGRFSVG